MKKRKRCETECNDDAEPEVAPNVKKKAYICDFPLGNGSVCSRSLSDLSALNKHKRTHTGEKPFVCKFKINDALCGKRFAQSGGLKSHEKTHFKVKPFECVFPLQNGICGKRFSIAARLVTHQRAHGQRPYVCNHTENNVVCNKTFKYLPNLLNHKRTHSGEKPFICDFKVNGVVCGRRFAQPSNLSTHKRTHTNKDRRYICDFVSETGVCGKRFTQNSTLTTHKQTHTGEKKFLCNFQLADGICAKMFRTQIHLTTHMRSHTGEKPYQCDFILENGTVCQKRFSQSPHLIKHKKIHAGIKRFQCTFTIHEQVCNKRFVVADDLKSHMRTHTQEKPYVCDFAVDEKVCTQRFGSKTALIDHKRRHIGQKPFRCPDENCDQFFTTKTEQRTHFFRWHSETAVLRRQTKEYRLSQVLSNAKIIFEQNCRINYGCITGHDTENGGLFDKKRAVLDFVIYKNNHVFIIECDEHQHSQTYSPWGYTISCELARMAHVQTALTVAATSTTSIGIVAAVVWIRYNPDMFFVDGVRQSRKITRKIRESHLLLLLETFVPTQPVSVIYMYYDVHTVNGKLEPKILSHEDYNSEFRKCVLDPIVD